MRLTKSQVQSTDLQEARATFVLSSKSPFHAPTMIYLLGLGASAFSSPACSSRVALSRVAQPVSTARVPLPLMCGRAPARATLLPPFARLRPLSEARPSAARPVAGVPDGPLLFAQSAPDGLQRH